MISNHQNWLYNNNPYHLKYTFADHYCRYNHQEYSNHYKAIESQENEYNLLLNVV